MNPQAQRPIGVFDSGVGGLTVMRALVEALPHEDLLYLGDTARVPYGNRGAETIRRYALNAARQLVGRNIKALVVACNTATAYALPALQDALEIPVFGVVDPVATLAARRSASGHIAMIGTRATVRSNSYTRALMNLRPDAHVHPIACPLLVPLAEEGWTEGPVVEQVLRHYLEPLASTPVDTMILGCTHYPLLHHAIASVAAEVMRRPLELLDSASATATALRETLAALSLHTPSTDPGSHRFLLTDLPEGFVETASRFFGHSVAERCEHVDIIDSFATSHG
ncbi:glutamate racemase [Bradymonadaceae bacterium TMQ3]|uniref:Glutamate racemase n=1 Tax=Lujinxingia sediminis TaxID=2480984 RepID=A0ABY0CRM9_9DELT|nr:glutamate racemase [Lujinxingia sediminis]RDV37933.1 glutamate racemase [Bradymonadaceae bacterium TMQ3]RVU42739.1 glutamate racemase [Lujinxingia sediminis]TXC75289.1 glutamate racemase [Bradymonadales bacterium TMQ1]